MSSKKIYEKINDFPTGRASDVITEGCIVLEGGGWKGLYTVGVLDAFMLNDINMSATVGISAGAMSAIGYNSGQIGWGVRVDLTYRHDPEYVGIGPAFRDHGVTGFSYLYENIFKELPLDKKRLMNPNRRLAVGVTNMFTGETEYMEKGKCNLSAAVRASATVPFVSRPIVIDSIPYLDGGCSTKIPYPWAEQEGFEKIIVVKTREWEYVRDTKPSKTASLLYKDYPEFVKAINSANENFNEMTKDLRKKHDQGEIYVLAPSKPVEVTRFESDLDKLADLYWLGFHDAESQIDNIKNYLNTSILK